MVHVLEIDHNGQVTEGLNTNGAPAGCLLNSPLMAVNSIRMEVDLHTNENVWPFTSSYVRDWSIFSS